MYTAVYLYIKFRLTLLGLLYMCGDNIHLNVPQKLKKLKLSQYNKSENSQTHKHTYVHITIRQPKEIDK